MNSEHEGFEMLCALFVSGQLAGDEIAELREHVAGCGDCRRSLEEMVEVDCGLASAQQSGRMPKGMQERFVARAVREGVPLRAAASEGSLLLHGWGLAFVALVFVVFAGFALRVRLSSGDVGAVASVAVDALPVRAAVSAAPVREVRMSRSVGRKRVGRRSSLLRGDVSADLQTRFTLYSPRVAQDGFAVSRMSLPKVSRLSSEYVLPGLGLRGVEEGKAFRVPQLWRGDDVRYVGRSGAKVASLLSLELPQSAALQEMRFSSAVVSPRSSVSQ
ncbi:zf-HC2 domain-containing protein [Granulicella sp. dw_53]|uniref:anti-sigma factor family protein n=1 Tax=Granulicella sp. dw_53 TaxID=2719792 RepID=UPI001BD25C15|nr:zf-HC2 domain-containing protein [Granulicella sp. dw_53]